MTWSFKCWLCEHFELGQYFQLPKTTCPKCGAGRTFTSLKRTQPTEESMPCYQVNTVSVDFQAGDLALLQKAAAVLGLTIVEGGALGREVRDRNGGIIATLRDNKAVCRQEHVATLNKLRVQYSREIVNHACLKMGWQKVVKSENKHLLRKGV